MQKNAIIYKSDYWMVFFSFKDDMYEYDDSDHLLSSSFSIDSFEDQVSISPTSYKELLSI